MALIGFGAGLGRLVTGFYVDRNIPNWGSTGHPRIVLITEVPGLYRMQIVVRRPNDCGAGT